MKKSWIIIDEQGDVYATASSPEIADEIIKRDTESGELSHEGAYVVHAPHYETIEEV